MPSWGDYQEIAALLEKSYPEVDRLNIEDEELVRMIMALPSFTGNEHDAGADDLFIILQSWVTLAVD